MWSIFSKANNLSNKVCELYAQSEYLGSRIDNKLNKVDIIECKTCGCLIYKSKAIEGEPKINKWYRQPVPFMWHEADWHKPEYNIERSFYCKRCAKDLESSVKETKDKKE